MNKSKLNKIKAYLISGALAAAIIFLLWAYITPTVAVINNDRTHEIVNPFGSLKVLDSENNEVELNDLKLCTRYVYNGTDTPLLGYNVLYSNDETEAEEFENEFYYASPNELIEVDEVPDFFFEEPESIEVNNHWLVSVIKAILGTDEERWIISTFPEKF